MYLWFVYTDQYGLVYYSRTAIFFNFPLSEAVNGSTIANPIVPLFWDPSVGVPSTVVRYLKYGARLTAEYELVDRESSLVNAHITFTIRMSLYFKTYWRTLKKFKLKCKSLKYKSTLWRFGLMNDTQMSCNMVDWSLKASRQLHYFKGLTKVLGLPNSTASYTAKSEMLEDVYDKTQREGKQWGCFQSELLNLWNENTSQKWFLLPSHSQSLGFYSSEQGWYVWETFSTCCIHWGVLLINGRSRCQLERSHLPAQQLPSSNPSSQHHCENRLLMSLNLKYKSTLKIQTA